MAGVLQAELGPDDPNVQEIRKMLREYERQAREAAAGSGRVGSKGERVALAGAGRHLGQRLRH